MISAKGDSIVIDSTLSDNQAMDDATDSENNNLVIIVGCVLGALALICTAIAVVAVTLLLKRNREIRQLQEKQRADENALPNDIPMPQITNASGQFTAPRTHYDSASCLTENNALQENEYSALTLN